MNGCRHVGNHVGRLKRWDYRCGVLVCAARASQVTKNMGSIVKALEKSLESNNLEKIADTMRQFERQFENLDLQTQVVDDVMGAQASMLTPEDDVNSLIQQVCVFGLMM